jgi:hypothetical protein
MRGVLLYCYREQEKRRDEKRREEVLEGDRNEA